MSVDAQMRTVGHLDDGTPIYQADERFTTPGLYVPDSTTGGNIRVELKAVEEPSDTPDPFAPSGALLTKLGSAIVHADEAMSENGVAEDEGAFRSLLRDYEVSGWVEAMNGMGLLPVKRDA